MDARILALKSHSYLQSLIKLLKMNLYEFQSTNIQCHQNQMQHNLCSISETENLILVPNRKK